MPAPGPSRSSRSAAGGRRSARPPARTPPGCSSPPGGSNGSRLRLWKVELARLAEELGLEISVSHFPPGTSKWNRIEHRLFAQISMNWHGRPLTSHEVIVETIAATTTKTGLTVQAALDTGTYEKGIKISDKEMKALEQNSIRRHDFHGEWNYCLLPAPRPTHPTSPK